MRSSLREYVPHFTSTYTIPTTFAEQSHLGACSTSVQKILPSGTRYTQAVSTRSSLMFIFPPALAHAQSSSGHVSSQWFKTPQGKVAELRVELASGGKKDKNNSAKKIALKKIVANMTMSNNDMVALFPDIINCMQIPSLEIKKMYA